MTKRFQRLGIPAHAADPVYFLRSLANVPTSYSERFHSDILRRKIGDHSSAAVCFYIVEDLVQCAEHAQQVLSGVQELFLGDWRHHSETDDGVVDPEWWHAHLWWTQEYRACLGWGSALGEWEQLKVVSEYPEGRCPVDESGEAEKVYLCSVADSILEKDLAATVESLKWLAGGYERRFALLANLELAFVDRDDAMLQRAFDQYLAYFAKHDAKQNTIVRISYEGTFYFHRGRAAGIPLKLSEKCGDYIVQLD